MKRGIIISLIILSLIAILPSSFVSAIPCSPTGIYDSTYFCNITGEFEELKPDHDECLNNYECIAGSCVYNGTDYYCEPKYKEIKEQTNILQTFFNNIIAFFSGIFTGISERGAPAAETGIPPSPTNLHAVYDWELNVVNLTWGR